MSRINDRRKAIQYDILIRAVKRRCRDECCCGDLESWRNCLSQETCSLWAFRMGNVNIPKDKESKKNKENHEEGLTNNSKNEVLHGEQGADNGSA